MTYRLPPPTAPQPPRYTVAQLIADRSLLVRVSFNFFSTDTNKMYSQDITRYVQRDPAHPFPIGAGGGGNVSRAFYRWRDRDSGLLRSLNVRIIPWLLSLSQIFNKTYKGRRQAYRRNNDRTIDNRAGVF